MKELCLISPAFAFPIGERGMYFPHGELAKALFKRGIKTTIICLGPNISYSDGPISVHAVPVSASNAPMLADWMPANTYYLAAAAALWNKYLELTASFQFDILDVPSYLPFDARSIPHSTALVVRSYSRELDGVRQNGGAYPVDRMMLENLQALALLQADAVLVDEAADAETNRWSRKLRNAFTARLMSELEAAIYASDDAILPKNDLSTVMVGNSAEDSEWGATCLTAIREFLKVNDAVRFILPIFQRELTGAENEVLSGLKQELAAANKLDRLYIIRPLAINKLSGCIQSADAVVAPLRDSGLPCIGMEAASLGKLIIVHDNNPLAKFAQMNNCGIVVPKSDSASLCEAFSEAIARKEDGSKGKEAASLLFDDYLNTSLKCYAAALEGHAQAGEDPLRDAPTASAAHPQLLVACDRLLYDIHYKTSLRFRVKHWINRLSQSKRHSQNKS